MSHTEVVHVQLREGRGSRHARHLRAQGHVPAVLYGHGEGTVSLTIPNSEIEALLRHGGRVVELQGAVTGNALVREVQWDCYGAHILHLDLARVSSGELVETAVPIDLRGDAPGARSGGIVQHVLHEIKISCPVALLPERLRVNINALELGDAITVADLELPAGATALADGDDIVVHCVEAGPEEVETVVAEGAEPEVIGRKAQEEESED
jgi:large subunit ribosomal protein L25